MKGSSQRGLTVVELLIALGIVMSVGAVIANLVPSARVAFERVPAELDVQQRGRMAIEVLSQALRSAGTNVVATADVGHLSDLVPTVSVSAQVGTANAFRALTVIAPVSDGAQGVLEVDQAGAASPIILAASPCPNSKDVCGFAPGATAMILAPLGGQDVFVISATNAIARSLTLDRVLSRAYLAGSVAIEINQHTYKLVDQPDGSASLVRVTAAGAVQPIVDFVNGLTFEVQGANVPAGFLRLNQVDVSVRIQASTDAMRRLIPDRVFKTSIRIRNAS